MVLTRWYTFFIVIIIVLPVVQCGNEEQKSSHHDTQIVKKGSGSIMDTADKPVAHTKDSSDNAPEIFFEHQKIDFGKVDRGKKFTHVFEFKNLGDANLNIENIRTTCGCTAAVTSSSEIPPGGAGSIEVTFNSGKLQGRQTKTVIINTNDPKHPIVKLHVTALVEVDVEVKPTSIFFGKKFHDEKTTKQFYIVDHMENQQLVIKKIDSEYKSRYLTWKYDRMDQNKYKVDVTLSPGAPVGSFRENLIVYTNSKKQPKIVVRIQATILGDIMVTPERVSFGIVKPGKPVSRKVEITHRKGNPFKVTNITPSSNLFKTELIPLEGAKKYQLTISLPENMGGNTRISGSVELEISLGSSKDTSVAIPIYGVIRAMGNQRLSRKSITRSSPGKPSNR